VSVLSAIPRKVRLAPRKIGYHWGPRLMSWVRKQWVLFRHPHANIVFEGPVYLGPGFSLHIPEDGNFIVGPAVEFRRGFRAELARGATVRIGAGSVFTYNVLIQCGRSIEIGERCMFGQSSAVFDGNHRFRELDRPMLAQGYDLRPVKLEDDAVVTENGCELISRGVPVSAGEIEALMRD